MYQTKRVVSLTEDWESLITDVKSLLSNFLPGWSNVLSEQVQVDKITGGITNLLLKLTPPAESGLGPVALRIFGDNTDILINRQQELSELLQLNSEGFGARVLGTFANGRVEEFLPYKALDPQCLAEAGNSEKIARRLAQLHNVQMDGAKEDKVFPKMHTWLNNARQLQLPDAAQQRKFDSIDLKDLEQEVRDLESVCTGTASPIVWGHGDLLAGNVMVPIHADHTSNGQQISNEHIQFIDFEYSCHMHRGFDWGNHFNEYAGFECDYGRYPDAKQAAHFLRHYLLEAYGNEPTEEELNRAVDEANLFALASHQFWGIWAFFQAAYSAIDFDYLEYAQMRWNEYRRRKEAFMQPFRHVKNGQSS